MGYTEKKPHNYKVEITKLKMRHMLRLLYGKPTVWIPTVTPPRTGNGSIGNERELLIYHEPRRNFRRGSVLSNKIKIIFSLPPR